jgi:hypothetical protein
MLVGRRQMELRTGYRRLDVGIRADQMGWQRPRSRRRMPRRRRRSVFSRPDVLRCDARRAAAPSHACARVTAFVALWATSPDVQAVADARPVLQF